MAKISAGLLLYRWREENFEVLLVHPGGPLWVNKDLGAWSIPKGEAEPGEDLLERARTELQEETGFKCAGPFQPLLPAKQPGKTIYAWIAQGDGDPTSIVSNTIKLEYPPRSGRFLTIPEVDKAGWFDLATAHEKIHRGQRGLLTQLDQMLEKNLLSSASRGVTLDTTGKLPNERLPRNSS